MSASNEAVSLLQEQLATTKAALAAAEAKVAFYRDTLCLPGSPLRALIQGGSTEEIEPRRVGAILDDLATTRAEVGRLREAMDATHLIEAAIERCVNRGCEREGYDQSGDGCLDACESMADFCDPCMIGQLVGTIEEARAALAPEAEGR